MQKLWKWILTEPVAVGAVLTALTSILVGIGIGEAEAGSIAAGVAAVVGVIARALVTPTAKLPEPAMDPPVTPGGVVAAPPGDRNVKIVQSPPPIIVDAPEGAETPEKPELL